ncbi:MAG: hypothetical protein FWF86_02165 [Clostridia bacterium]|nr:hypothetical protein [Clostridia bacterium]
MYRLLVVTKEPRVQDMFTAMEGWEAMGFKPPRIRESVDEAMESMKKHQIDAIALDDHPAFESLIGSLNETNPTMPIFEIADDADAQWAVCKEVYQLLAQLHADNSNDDMDRIHRFQLARERWIKKLLCGMAPTKKSILANHRLLRCDERADSPRLYVRLHIPQGNSFIAERWHYGSDRLEVALRNFFGQEHDYLRFYPAVLSPKEVRVMVSSKPECWNGEELEPEQALGFIQDVLEQIEDCLGLSMKLAEIRRMDSLTAFAAEEHQV